MPNISYHRHRLIFKRPSGTSRGILTTKDSWIFILEEEGAEYYGECGLLQGLSCDDLSMYEQQLDNVCRRVGAGDWNLDADLAAFPSIRFGVEMLRSAYQRKDAFELFPSDFTRKGAPIPINGLVWMGEKAFMKAQIIEKIEAGFNCIKLKIGAIGFQEELDLLAFIRREFSAKEIEIRVDANGAFSPSDAIRKIQRLSAFDLHSIEQPIRQGQWQEMAALCEKTPLPIALDEELIGIHHPQEKQRLIHTIQPQYIILKPSLVGGFAAAEAWMAAAAQYDIPWWATSALESNIGLNAIAQWVFTKGNPMPQGLGTGKLYTNNFPYFLEVRDGGIHGEVRRRETVREGIRERLGRRA